MQRPVTKETVPGHESVVGKALRICRRPVPVFVHGLERLEIESGIRHQLMMRATRNPKLSLGAE